jgi:glycosyltransferase involved in cell wall biosynthesis
VKICFICNEYPPGPHGGIGTSTQVLARALVERGHIVRVVGVYKSDYPSPDFENDQGVQVWRLRQNSLPKLGWLLDRMRLFFLIRKLSRRGEIDIVEAPDYQGWTAYWGKLPIPICVRLHGSGTIIKHMLKRQKETLSTELEKAALKRADVHVGISSYILKTTQEIFGIRFNDQVVIHHPVVVPFSLDDYARRKKNVVVFAGTLNENKGILSLIDAWVRVTRELPNSELHLYGKDGLLNDGKSAQKMIVQKIAKQEIVNVFLHGHVAKDEIYMAFSNARLSVFPSFIEGLSLVTLESMASGCPTIFTVRASGPEIIFDGEDGVLVNPSRPDEIAEQILRLLKDDMLAQRIGRNGRQKILTGFSVEKLTTLNEIFFQRAIQNFYESTNQRVMS